MEIEIARPPGTGPYQCPRHEVWLVPRERSIRKRGGRVVKWPYYACPVAGCRFVKSNKWRLPGANDTQ